MTGRTGVIGAGPEAADDRHKWPMLAIVSAGFLMMTMNWFAIAPGFGQISDEFGLEIPQVALLISVFVIGYGVFHIPGGFVATRWGMRAVLALGLAVEGLAAVVSALAPDYWTLMAVRVVAGIGASVFAAIGVAAVSVWFQHRHHALALGVTSACFAVGSALGLYVWDPVTGALGWRGALALGGALCLVVAAVSAVWFRVPAGSERLHGVRLTRQAVRETLGNRDMWLYGVAFLGAYGAFLGGSQLIAGYGADERHFSSGEVGLAALLIGVAGVPGSVLGGWIGDRFASVRTVFTVAAMVEGLFFFLVPLSGPGWFWLPAFGIGFMFNFGFSVWQTVPGSARGISEENIGTAIGLMLSVSAIGGFLLPFLFGRIVPSAGYPMAWGFFGVVSIVCALAALLVRVPKPAKAVAPIVTGGAASEPATG
ncbi:MFS transporter [Actinomadura hibisca]|uniref:MFS transporter n=1 Tax=Actinomadura hibisca TaxID=68565 RepID=UPI001471AA01|nr:MFS transporter [Actinomadura hibisca]